MTKKKKNGGKKLTAQQLQIEILKFLLGHPKKSFAPRQITDQLRVENNRDSTEHALNQLVQAGSVAQFAENKYGIALGRLTVDDGEGIPENGKKAHAKSSLKDEFSQNKKVRPPTAILQQPTFSLLRRAYGG